MSDSADATSHGRVDPDGTVYVITAAGERRVGQVPDVTPEEALVFFQRRFTALETECSLLGQRVQSGTMSPDEARKQINSLKRTIAEANAVGDLDALVASLDTLAPVVETQMQERRAVREQQHEQTRQAKEALLDEAEKLANSDDWRGGMNHFRSLLDRWKALPRIDKTTDDELWHRFSAARTAYSRRRKAQFAHQAQHREEARKIKEAIIRQAEDLAHSTDWGETARAFRDLMAQWKAAGPAPREVDDKLWAQFRALQDTFFDARNALLQEQDEEFRSNQQAKEALLDEAEKTILPVGDVQLARGQLRDFLEKFNSYGRVPRDALRSIDARVRSLEQAVKTAEDQEWKRTDPEARQRAADTVAMFTSQIDKLNAQADAAQARGDAKKAAQLHDSINTYQGWLEQARKALEEFSA